MHIPLYGRLGKYVKKFWHYGGIQRLEHIEKEEAKVRILNASIQLFSEKGFDATRVNEIATAASVNKALIYYYFKSKEDILDYLMDSLFHEIASITMDFIHENIVQMIKDGRLDIEPDRLRFVNAEEIEYFLHNTYIYYEQVIDYVLKHRLIIRILLLESLKNSKHRDGLFHFLEFMKKSDDNPLYKTIWEADKDFNYSDDMMLFKFFFSMIPLVSFAAYFDDYKRRSLLSEQELRRSLLRSYQIVTSSLISGSEILMRNQRLQD